MMPPIQGEIRCSSHWTPTIGPGSLEAPGGLRGKRISPEERLSTPDLSNLVLETLLSLLH